MAQGREVAVITGANRGIGREIARQLAQEGVDVIATARDEKAGRRAAREVGARYARVDVTEEESIEALASSLDGLDILVNNAGVAMAGFNAEVARKTLRVNFFGVLRLTDRLLPLLRPHARIVNVSSGMGALSGLPLRLRERLSDPDLSGDELVGLMRAFVEDVERGVHEERGWPSSAYKVSKAGLNALTRILAP